MHQVARPVFDQDIFTVQEKSGKSEVIASKLGKQALTYICKYVNFQSSETTIQENFREFLNFSSPQKTCKSVVILNPISKEDFGSDFANHISKKLEDKGILIGSLNAGQNSGPNDSNSYLQWNVAVGNKQKVNRKFPIPYPDLNGNLLYKTKMDVFGRLYYSGFEIISETSIDDFYFFVAKKTRTPSENPLPTSSPVIRLKRVTKNGKIISIYKFRTMYPYSEYLQDYIYKNNQLHSCGKFNNDLRISRIGNFLRKYWIDEIPMIINLLRGDIKFVGVRPLSLQYFNLYPDDLKELRINFKPGLVPPFYADLPNDFNEILDSERNYLLSYIKNPYLTDIKYLFRALFNIFVRFKRSR